MATRQEYFEDIIHLPSTPSLQTLKILSAQGAIRVTYCETQMYPKRATTAPLVVLADPWGTISNARHAGRCGYSDRIKIPISQLL